MSGPASKTLGQVLDEAASIHRRYSAMVHVAEQRAAHGDGDGPAARAARHQAQHFAERHAGLVAQAVALQNRHLATLPVTQENP